MFGIVIVSHSRVLARSLSELAAEISGKNIPIAYAGGVEGKDKSFGTDATDIMETIESVYSDEGVIIFADMGSALLSSETALDFLDPEKGEHVYISSGPIVEGVISAAIQCGIGSSLKVSAAEAEESLIQKIEYLKKDERTLAILSPLRKGPPSMSASETISGAGEKKAFKIRNINGIHARPAAKFIKAVSNSGCRVEVTNLSKGKGPVNGLSLNRLSTLEVLEGEEILVSAEGSEKSVSLFFNNIETLINDNFGENDKDDAEKSLKINSELFNGGIVSLSEGIALGKAYLLDEISLNTAREKSENTDEELEKLKTAVNRVKSEIKNSVNKGKRNLPADKMQIIETHIYLLDDPDLIEESIRRISEEKLTAASAWSLSSKDIVKRYENLTDIYMKVRSSDVKDVSSRVLNCLLDKNKDPGEIPEGSVVIAESLNPSQVLRFDPDKINGILITDSDTTSHAAILAKSLGIPALGGYEKTSLIKQDQMIGFDSSSCEVYLDPGKSIQKDLLGRKEILCKKKLELQKKGSEPAITKDGKHIMVYANISSLAEAEAAVKNGADGVGVLRTEFLFLDKNSPPTEEEQYSFFSSVFKTMEGKPVTVRTLDIGGDKKIPYMNLPVENNPFLGLRGVRIYDDYIDLIKIHIRAILRAGFENDLKIMIPMISRYDECLKSYNLINNVHKDLLEENIQHIWPVEIGIMIETPASVIMAYELAGIADFFSIGTNDLTQYLLAAERGNPDLAAYSDPYDPSVLRALRKTILAAERAGIEVSLCGEFGGDTRAIPLLIGIGIQSLSMNPFKIPEVKEAVKNVSVKDCSEKIVHVLFKSVSPLDVKKIFNI